VRAAASAGQSPISLMMRTLGSGHVGGWVLQASSGSSHPAATFPRTLLLVARSPRVTSHGPATPNRSTTSAYRAIAHHARPTMCVRKNTRSSGSSSRLCAVREPMPPNPNSRAPLRWSAR
jgi:hypothetical protein